MAQHYLQMVGGPHSGSLAIIQLLLQRGADVNARDRIGETARYQTITADHTDIALCLVQHGAKVDTYTVNGATIGWSVKLTLDRM